MKAPTRTGGALAVPSPAASPGEVTVTFPDNRHASALYGQYDQNIARIERALGVVAHALGNQVAIKGPPDA